MFTALRVDTSGATTSTGRRLSASMGPLPSMGSPRALTTLPTRASPTGTSTIRPVLRTSLPSLTERGSPMMTAPTLSLFQVQRHTRHAASELQQLVIRHTG